MNTFQDHSDAFGAGQRNRETVRALVGGARLARRVEGSELDAMRARLRGAAEAELARRRRRSAGLLRAALAACAVIVAFGSVALVWPQGTYAPMQQAELEALQVTRDEAGRVVVALPEGERPYRVARSRTPVPGGDVAWTETKDVFVDESAEPQAPGTVVFYVVD